MIEGYDRYNRIVKKNLLIFLLFLKIITGRQREEHNHQELIISEVNKSGTARGISVLGPPPPGRSGAKPNQEKTRKIGKFMTKTVVDITSPRERHGAKNIGTHPIAIIKLSRVLEIYTYDT